MKIKLSSLCLALVMCLSLAAVPVRAADPSVKASPQTFIVDGKPVKAEIYNIDGSNYFKLRDVAMLLKDTPARFAVSYDAQTRMIDLADGGAYVPDGSELKTGADKSATCVPSTQSVTIDGEESGLRGYNIGGNNFFKLRELGYSLGFYVGYDQEKNAALIDSGCYIDRVYYDEGLPVSLYYEIPRFYGEGEGLRKIESDLARLREAFAADEAVNAREYAAEHLENRGAAAWEEPYQAEWSASVFTRNDDIVSVGISYAWYMGGVFDYGMTCYNFNTAFGVPVYLTDVVDGSVAEIKEMIVKALLEQYPGVEEAGVMGAPMDAIREKDIKDFSFYVADGAVHVFFSKYEIAYGAAGVFDVVLPVAAQPTTKG